MVKALAVEVAGFQAVSGTTKYYLQEHGHYIFHFQHMHQADEFRKVVAKYIPIEFAQVE